MAFVDIKCLESLLIEGEDLIATEGLGSSIKGFFKRIFDGFIKAIRIIAGLFKKLAAKFHNKALNNKNDEPNNKNDEPKEKEPYRVKDNIFRATIVEDFINSVDNCSNTLVRLNNNCIADCVGPGPDRIVSRYNNIKEKLERYFDLASEYYSEVDMKHKRIIELLNKCDNEIYFTVAQTCAKYCDNASNKLYENANAFESKRDKFDELVNANKISDNYGITYENTKEAKAAYSALQKACSKSYQYIMKLQKIVSDTTNVLNSATIVYD